MHLHKIITIISMDRQIPVCNRLIDKKMQEFRSRKHRQTLSQIKNKSNNSFYTTMYQQTPNHNRYSSTYLENKNLQIEKQNIKLFNKIASIIREKPKAAISHSSSYAQSCSKASGKYKKQQQRIKTENQILQRRISEQKPTIQNKQFFKDRIKNVKYLKIIGRYPYEGTKRNQSAQDPNENQNTIRTADQISNDVQIYQKRTQDFFVRIVKIPNNYFIFNVEMDGVQKSYQYVMKKSCFDQQFMRCGYNYDKLIGQLRLNQDNEIKFQYFPAEQFILPQ